MYECKCGVDKEEEKKVGHLLISVDLQLCVLVEAEGLWGFVVTPADEAGKPVEVRSLREEG